MAMCGGVGHTCVGKMGGINSMACCAHLTAERAGGEACVAKCNGSNGECNMWRLMEDLVGIGENQEERGLIKRTAREFGRG